MEEQDVARIHLHIDQFQALLRFVYALQPAIPGMQDKPQQGKVVNFKLDEAELERVINEAS